MQYLTMPFTAQMMLCGYKNAKYRAHWGYNHYGVDISTYQGGAGSDHAVYASGEGRVLACGFDNAGGNVVVVLYPEVYNHRTRVTCDLVARYLHLASIAAKVGEAVVGGQVLGQEGKTQTGDYHLHIELDTDTRWALYSPQVGSKDDQLTAAQGNILKKGTDSTVNPSDVFYLGLGQTIVPPTYNPAWLNQEDKGIPAVPAADAARLQKRVEELEGELERTRERLDRIAQLAKE